MKIKKNTWFYTSVIIGLFFLLTSSCKKEIIKVTPIKFTDSVIDIDGNVYKTIKIGKQWWMAENLKVTRYKDSTPIIKISVNPTFTNPDTIWANTKKGSYCIYENNVEYVKTYGLLYNWYAITDSNKIAPEGWHIPTDEDWKELEIHLGMAASEVNSTSWRGTNEAEKLKTLKIDTTSRGAWTREGDIWATNESGFSALASSCCMFQGKWGDPGIGSTGFWWTATENGNQAWYRHLDYKNSTVFRYYGPKTYGFSVRCIKNL